jgi:hypothetical protein
MLPRYQCSTVTVRGALAALQSPAAGDCFAVSVCVPR